MKTKIVKVSDRNSKIISEAAELIKRGELVAFPTETVYGLGADAFNEAACKKIYEVKGRPDSKPLSLLVSDVEMIEAIAEVSALAKRLIDTFMPGPLTLILNQKKNSEFRIPHSSAQRLVPHPSPCVSDAPDNSAFRIPNSELTVGVRMPDHEITLALIKAAKVPIAAPSANISGQSPPTSAEEVFESFNGKIPLILDGGECKFGLSSTIVDLSSNEPKILRKGAIPEEDIFNIIFSCGSD